MGSALSTFSSPRPPATAPKSGGMLVNGMSVVDAVTSTVPLPVMALMNAVRAGELPDGVAVLQVMPCSETVAPAGQRIFSLWQGPDVETVSKAVDQVMGAECTSTLFAVMEDFSHGIERESASDAALRVARSAGAKLIEVDRKLGVSSTVESARVAVGKAATDAGTRVSEKAAPVLQKVSDNHVVKNVNKQVQSGMDWVHGLLNPKKPETINAPEQLTRVAGADENGQEVNEEKEAKEAKGKEPAQTADPPAEVAAQTTA